MSGKVVLAVIRPGDSPVVEDSREFVKKIFSEFGQVTAVEFMPTAGRVKAFVQFALASQADHCVKVAADELSPEYKAVVHMSTKQFVVENISKKHPRQKKALISSPLTKIKPEGSKSPASRNDGSTADPLSHHITNQTEVTSQQGANTLSCALEAKNKNSSADLLSAFELDFKLARAKPREFVSALFSTPGGCASGQENRKVRGKSRLKRPDCPTIDLSPSDELVEVTDPSADLRNFVWIFELPPQLNKKQPLVNVFRSFGIVQELTILPEMATAVVRFATEWEALRAVNALRQQIIFERELRLSVFNERTSQKELFDFARTRRLKRWVLQTDQGVQKGLNKRFVVNPSNVVSVTSVPRGLTAELMAILLTDTFSRPSSRVRLDQSSGERSFEVTFEKSSQAIEAVSQLNRLLVNDTRLKANLLDESANLGEGSKIFCEVTNARRPLGFRWLSEEESQVKWT